MRLEPAAAQRSSPRRHGRSGDKRVLSQAPRNCISSGCVTYKNIIVCLHGCQAGPGSRREDSALLSPRQGWMPPSCPCCCRSGCSSDSPGILHSELRPGVFPQVWGFMHQIPPSFGSIPGGWKAEECSAWQGGQ